MKLQTPTKTLKVCEFNELLSCSICEGYLINPTTVDLCLHTYCRSCIAQHLLHETYCPQCKIAGGGKQISVSNLKSDDVLRTLIFKLIPGLYQKERERATQFKLIPPRNGQQKLDDEEVGSVGSREQDTIEENFFATTEPISLSLEYHPALLKGCSTSQIPQVRYLQCPAGLKIRHLKRFLCSKFDIDPECKRIEVEVIYEDEVLPNDFTLMDVGYCYNWKRHAPMKFTYRILFYGDESQKPENDINKSDIEIKRNEGMDTIKAIESPRLNADNPCDETTITVLPSATSPPSSLNCRTEPILYRTSKSKNKSPKSIRVLTNKVPTKPAIEEVNAPVKMIIARKTSADNGKKPSPKRNNNEEVTYTVTNDFKSLRSNDMRYSDYAVSSTTSNSNSPKSSPKSGAQRSPKSADVPIVVDDPPSPAASVVPKCDIVVSIPQSQMPKSPYSIDDEFENVSLAQLKTASKKSPPSATTTVATMSPKSTSTRNVPKLKIELNSLKTRLSISKPKSAGVECSERGGRVKQRKHSLDDVAAPLNECLDLETYAKNIGLQPIEVLTPPESAESCEKLKYSPNASPLSSASSTTSSSNNAFPLTAPTELATTSSFHKKRKKKHSKDSKEPKDSKRRRMHAEISSKPEEESLKMKVKLTAPHNHKSHKSESSGTKKNNDESRKSQSAAKECSNVVAIGSPIGGLPNDSILALNKTLGEESRSINHLMMEKEKNKEIVKVVRADETLLTLPQSHVLSKPVNMIKDVKLPASPPLPPSLFKTTPLNFNTLTVTSTTSGQLKSSTSASKQSEGIKGRQTLLTATKPSAIPQYNRQVSAPGAKSHPHFIVPSLPRRSTPTSNTSYTPTSIASASSKQLGMQLKRSASLDESYAVVGRGKQPKLDAAQRKSLYSSYSHKPFTPPSSTVSITKIADTVTQVQSSSGANSAVTITARSPSGIAQAQSRWQLPPYTQLHLPFNKPAVEIVRINSSQGSSDIQLQPTLNTTKSGRMMGPPLSMVKGKKAAGQQLGALSTSSAVKGPQAPLNVTPPLGNGRTNAYRLSPPALVNLQSPAYPPTKKVAEPTGNKQENNGITNGSATEKRISLREFRPNSRDQMIEMADAPGSNPSDKDEVRLADTTASATVIAPTARESLEAALNKIKQNITSTTVQDSVAASAAKQLSSPTDMSSDDLQNLHLLSESATAREKIAIRASQSYEKPKSQQSSLVRQQNASVRNIPNPSALAFRNMSTLPTAVSATAGTTTTTISSSIATSSPASLSTQKKLTLTTLPLTGVPAPLSPGVLLHSTTATSSGTATASPTTSATATATATATASSTTTTALRTIKKPTTIDQVAANLNMRASAAAAEAYAAKLSAAEDAAQISSSTGSSTTLPNDMTKVTSATNMAASSTTTTTTKPTTVPAAAEQANKAVKTMDGEGDESVKKAKVLPISMADSGVTTATIVTDAASIKNAGSKNNNNNNNNNSKQNNNNNNNNSNSNSNGNGKYNSVTAASVASD